MWKQRFSSQGINAGVPLPVVGVAGERGGIPLRDSADHQSFLDLLLPFFVLSSDFRGPISVAVRITTVDEAVALRRPAVTDFATQVEVRDRF